MFAHLETESNSLGRVIVLGATGFVGRDLAGNLKSSGVEVLGVSSAEIDLTRPESIAELERMVRADDSLVIVSAITPDKGKDVATLMRNLSMGQHLSALLEKNKCRQVVYISSDAVYADDANPVTEDSCCDPSSFHGLMHLVRERMFAAACQMAGTPLLVLRPTAIYGGGDTHNSYGPNRFMRTALKEKQIKLFGQGEEKRDHLYVRDLSELASHCLRLRTSGILNVASGQSISFFDLAELIGKLSGDEVRIEGSARANPVTHRHFEIASLRRGFPDLRVTALEDGLRESLREISAA
jgi:nucleoside-diphosphate-sugar epimerase